MRGRNAGPWDREPHGIPVRRTLLRAQRGRAKTPMNGSMYEPETRHFSPRPACPSYRFFMPRNHPVREMQGPSPSMTALIGVWVNAPRSKAATAAKPELRHCPRKVLGRKIRVCPDEVNVRVPFAYATAGAFLARFGQPRQSRDFRKCFKIKGVFLLGPVAQVDRASAF
jgi:hypothetical protein